MADKKKSVNKAINKKGGEKTTNKKVIGKEKAQEAKKLDKKIIAVIAAVIVLVVGVVVFLIVSGTGKGGDNPTDTASFAQTEPLTTADDVLWAEHNALFEELKKVYWLGEYENYKSLIPLAAWEAYAAEEGISLEEVYAKAEQELASMEPSENQDIQFYITKTTKLEGEDFNEIAGTISNMYDMEVTDFEEIYMLDVEVVATIDGERRSEYDTYYSIKIDGVRYLATDTGFVG